MATTVQTRAVGTATSLSTTSKVIAIPAGFVAGDRMTLFFTSGAGPVTVISPSGWIPLFSGDDGNVYWHCWTKKAVAGDISTGNVTLTVPAAGKSAMCIFGHYSTYGDVVPAVFGTAKEASVDGSHAAPAVTLPGPGTVVSVLGLKDTTTSVSANYAAPAGQPASATATTGGVSQVSVSYTQSATNDVAAGAFGSGTAWTITQSDGTTPATSSRAVAATFAMTAVRRPSGDISTPAGATFTGGATLQDVAGDDDPATYMEYSGSGVTWEERIGVGAVVPNYVQVDVASTAGTATTNLHGYLYLGASQLLDLGSLNTLVPTTGDTRVWSLAALSGAQKTSILADPTNLRFRCTATVT